MVSYDATLNVTTTSTSVLKTSGSDSYTDNYAETSPLGSSGTVSISGTPQAVDSKNYVLALNEGWTSGDSLTNDSLACWNGGGATGKAYCVTAGSLRYTVSSGITTSTVLMVEYDYDNEEYNFYQDGTLVHTQAAELVPPSSEINGIIGSKQAGNGMQNLSTDGPAPPPSSATVHFPPSIARVRF